MERTTVAGKEREVTMRVHVGISRTNERMDGPTEGCDGTVSKCLLLLVYVSESPLPSPPPLGGCG